MIQDVFQDISRFQWVKINSSAKQRSSRSKNIVGTSLPLCPLYIVLREHDHARMEYIKKKFPSYKLTHSFSVRGHWRRLQNPMKYGKDRDGNYIVLGSTWVSACIKGQGKLIKRPRVILSRDNNEI